MSAARSQTEEEQRNRATLEAFQAAWGARDVAALGRLMTQDCVYSASVGPEPGTTWRGREAVIAGINLMLANDPGQSSSGETVYAGDKAFSIWTIEGYGTNGQPLSIRGSDLFEFKNGLIARKDAFRKVEASLTPAPAPIVAQRRNPFSAPMTTTFQPMHRSNIFVRAFVKRDVPQLLQLMRGLAKFEGYLDDFKVTEADLIAFGLGQEPQFEALVAVNHETSETQASCEHDGTDQLLGCCVLYRIPWTYDMRPKLVMKELFVAPHARGCGVGAALLQGARDRARQLGASSLVWTVLNGNKAAETFYLGQGGTPDPLWNNWTAAP